MPPHPKRKHSKSRRDLRRTHDVIVAVPLVACGTCSKMVPQHTVCPECGHYEGREIFVVKQAEKKG